MNRVMEIDTPLGSDTLLFHAMHATEEMGRLSEYQVDLLSMRCDIDLDEILGKNVTVKLALGNDQTRYFNGYVTRFAHTGTYGRYHRYVAAVRPWRWFLTRTSDCRIFQNLAVPDILRSVFGDHDTAEFKLELTQTYPRRTYCVQYRETDFDFVSRLMEHEGIYYYFRHSDGHNTLVLTDSVSSHASFTTAKTLPFIPPEKLVRPEVESISRWEFAREVQPGAYVHDDYDLERPTVEIQTHKTRTRKHAESSYEMYDYPGRYLEKPEGESYAGVRLDEFGAQYELAHATTNARGLCVGYRFTLERHSRGDQNGEHLVVSATHDLEYSAYEGLPKTTAAEYACTFTAMPTSQQYRPRRLTPKPIVQGPQTAMVVGPAGDEIHTDKYGRVKVQFHWDRLGRRDENSSCWVRVSHPWAGKGWGAVATPRIGQEVIVDFLEGDPDQPIITGRVYNADCQPPFGFPAGAVISGVKSDTHKGSGYNELSMDDTAGTEKVTIHAQFDMNTTVEHDQTTTVHDCRTDRIDVNDSETIGVNQSLAVGANRTKKIGANETITIGANRTSTVGASETATVALQRTHSVGINETISVGGAQEITVGGLQAITVGAAQTTAVGASRTVSVGRSQTTTVGANASTSIGSDETRSVTGGRTSTVGKDDVTTVGKNLIVDAGDSVTIKTGSASFTMKKDGTIVIKGKDITLQGSGKINVKASSDVVIKGSKVGVN